MMKPTCSNWTCISHQDFRQIWKVFSCSHNWFCCRIDIQTFPTHRIFQIHRSSNWKTRRHKICHKPCRQNYSSALIFAILWVAHFKNSPFYYLIVINIIHVFHDVKEIISVTLNYRNYQKFMGPMWDVALLYARPFTVADLGPNKVIDVSSVLLLNKKEVRNSMAVVLPLSISVCELNFMDLD